MAAGVQLTSKPKSANMAMMPYDWAAPLTNAYSSASPLDNAMTVCVVDEVFSVCGPQVTAPPLVEPSIR